MNIQSTDSKPLTARQLEIVALVARGLSNKGIGRELGISYKTVKTHLHNAFVRTGIQDRTLLAVTVIRKDRE